MPKTKSTHTSNKHRSKHHKDRCNRSDSESEYSSDECEKDNNHKINTKDNICRDKSPCKNDTKCDIDLSNKCNIKKGDKGDKGDCGERGDKGSKGDQGPIGPQGPSGDRTFIVFATSESVSNNDYIGSGNSSSNILIIAL